MTLANASRLILVGQVDAEMEEVVAGHMEVVMVLQHEVTQLRVTTPRDHTVWRHRVTAPRGRTP